MTESSTRAESLQKLRELTKDIHVVMLTTIDEDGVLHSRPMGSQPVDPDGVLWFFTEAEAGKVQDIQQQQQVNVAYSHPSERWVSVSGTATLVRDAEKMRELWNPFVQAWFPQGPESPTVALLKVHVTSAEYWESPGGPVVQLIKIVRSAITHQPPTDLGTSEKLTISEGAAR